MLRVVYCVALGFLLMECSSSLLRNLPNRKAGHLVEFRWRCLVSYHSQKQPRQCQGYAPETSDKHEHNSHILLCDGCDRCKEMPWRKRSLQDRGPGIHGPLGHLILGRADERHHLLIMVHDRAEWCFFAHAHTSTEPCWTHVVFWLRSFGRRAVLKQGCPPGDAECSGK